ncbi:MAG: DUF2294 domain-containing protein [Victivallales bacterium]|nr:DUF2294 domain-containing protein [Victivallales bacterium]
MVSKRSKEPESEISEALVKFEKEYMGRGPLEAKTYIFDDIVLVRLKGVLTKAEHQLASSGSAEASEGRDLIKKVRQALLEKARPLLEAVVEDILKKEVASLHTDISTATGERIIIFTLKKHGNIFKDA